MAGSASTSHTGGNSPAGASASHSSASTSASAPRVHLLVAVHGLWGSPTHLSSLLSVLMAQHGGTLSPRSDSTETAAEPLKDVRTSDSGRAWFAGVLQQQEAAAAAQRRADSLQLVVLNTCTSEGAGTYDGIDWIGERAVAEVTAEVKRLRSAGSKVVRFSILGYSLGGLTARFVVGQLQASGFFSGEDAPIATNFTTFASPHLGMPPPASAFGRIVSFIGGRILSRTGAQLVRHQLVILEKHEQLNASLQYMRDSGWEHEALSAGAKGREKRGLIEAMSQPGSAFVMGLQRFERCDIYANAVLDLTVPARTGLVEPWDALEEWAGDANVTLDPDYPSIITGIEAPEHVKPKTLRSRLPRLPWFLSPSRLPFSYPVSLLLVVLSPVVFPLIFIPLVLVRFARESRASRRRIEAMHEAWREGKEPGSDPHRTRAETLLRTAVESATEDRVQAPDDAPAPAHASLGAHQAGAGSPAAAHMAVPLPPGKRKAPPLSEAQLRICERLNDRTALPRLVKHRVYTEDVINTHAIIIVRTPSISFHRLGLPVLRHFAEQTFKLE